MARLLELCLATLALFAVATSAAPMPCGGGAGHNTGIVPPHCVTACEPSIGGSGCTDQIFVPHEVAVPHEVIVPHQVAVPHEVIFEHDHDNDHFEHIHEHGDDCHDHDGDHFEFDDEDFFDDDEFEDDDCEEGEDFLDGGALDNEDPDFGEDRDCHHHIHGCIPF